MGVPTAHYEASHARPYLSVATHDRQPFYYLVPRDLKRQVPLTNNEEIRVAPGESTPNPKAGPTLGSDSSVWPRSGLVSPINEGTSLAHQVWTNRGTKSPLARVVRKLLAADQLCMRFQMVNQLGPPLEMLEAR